ncbi:hypothetical protein CCAX7_64060 [Capsulimonas corticalis]|uniref:DUF5658 domain-containing protein n=1 Tax=Capsulimonas corticalis TaxID=2219043 RepID=A0A402CQQ7_9BACT|nr:DUF5658 family protein [Capsulimonas corticalis]BDI34355.1 hypothetical protein CCAX7_64060 [Capsulimonas corticalis]
MALFKSLFAWDSLAIFILCTADMLSTLYWVNAHVATEANPYMNFWLQKSDAAFCIAKMMSYVPLLLVAAYYRPQRPRFIRVSLRGALALYIALYVFGIAAQTFLTV